MKKLLFVFLASLVFFSCQKKEENANLTQDVVFSIDKIDPGNLLKSTVPPICPTDGQGNLLIPTYAKITITDGTTPIVYSPQVFELNGLLYTQVIKFPIGAYTVTDFLLYDVNDVLIMATPAENGEYAEYVTKAVDFTFEVTAFEKVEIAVEVLCYLPENHDYFGFVWFNITEIVLRELCFFGDICLNGDPFTPEDFDGSLYGTGLGIDVPAIMKIVVKNNGVEVPNSPFNNETTSLTGPLCVQYPDKLNVDNEVFTFELWVFVKNSSGGFSYQLYYTFTSTDDGALDVDGGIDGIVEFVIGTCNYSTTDKQFDWLPAPPPPPVQTNFETFKIRDFDSSIVPPWDASLVIVENIEGDGFSAETPQGGQKVGYGTNQFDNMQINKFETVNWNKISGVAGIVSYLNFWVSDGTNWAVISSENDYRATDFSTRQEWKVFEYDTGIALDWLFDSGAGARDGSQYLTLDGVRVTIDQLNDNIYLLDPGSPYPSYVGTGAPRGDYGFQLIFGDTQANYVGSYHLDQLTITVDGIVYEASN